MTKAVCDKVSFKVKKKMMMKQNISLFYFNSKAEKTVNESVIYDVFQSVYNTIIANI